MGYYLSGITWFDEDVWIGREFILLQSKWKLAQKLAEVEQVSTEQDVRELALMSESRSVFIASNIESSGQEAVVKFRMQCGFLAFFSNLSWLPRSTGKLTTHPPRIPYFSTAFKTRQVRAKQAAPDIRKYSQYEIRALEHLTKLKCSSTPAIFAWKHETQGDDDWVPGGYLDYILMERLPGSRPNGFPGSMERKDRDQLRAAFKKAWM